MSGFLRQALSLPSVFYNRLGGAVGISMLFKYLSQIFLLKGGTFQLGLIYFFIEDVISRFNAAATDFDMRTP